MFRFINKGDERGKDDKDLFDFNSRRLRSTMASLSINELIDDDCLLKIFSYLSIIDLIYVQEVCQRWKILCERSWKLLKTLDCRRTRWYFSRECGKKQHKMNHIKLAMQILPHCAQHIIHFHLLDKLSSNGLRSCGLLLNMVSCHCKNLEEINIEKVQLSASQIRCLIAGSLGLKKLIIGNIGWDFEEELSLWLKEMKKLKYFSIRPADYTSVFTAISGAVLKNLPEQLEELHLYLCYEISSVFIVSALKKLSHLSAFTCNGGYSFSYSSAINKTIGEKKALTNLSLQGSNNFSSSLNHLANLINLEKLDLQSNEELNDLNLIMITDNCKQIKYLDISLCTLITNRGLSSISQLRKLEKLRMAGLSRVSDNPIGYFSHTLTLLWCEGCRNIGDDGIMKLITRSSNLKTLGVQFCPAITNRIIETAISAVETRMNDIILTIYTDMTGIDLDNLEEAYGKSVDAISPLLKIKSMLDENW